MRCVDKNQCFEGKFWPSYVVNPSRNDHRLHVECGRTGEFPPFPGSIRQIWAARDNGFLSQYDEGR